MEVFHGPSPPFPFNLPLKLNYEHSSTWLVSKDQVVTQLPLNVCITCKWTCEVRGVFVQLEHHKYITKCIKEHDQSIRHMYATNQSKFRESKTFSSLRSLQKGDDYYSRFEIATFGRILRYLASFFAMTLPGFYLAVTNFHTQILLSLIHI